MYYIVDNARQKAKNKNAIKIYDSGSYVININNTKKF